MCRGSGMFSINTLTVILVAIELRRAAVGALAETS
jgi:hypothetical protein